jgi:hypothetical protein
MGERCEQAAGLVGGRREPRIFLDLVAAVRAGRRRGWVEAKGPLHASDGARARPRLHNRPDQPL